MSENPRRQSLVSASAQLVVGRMYFLVLSYVVVVLLARILGREIFGRYVLVMAVLTWVEVITTGLNHLIMNRTARGLWSELRGIQRRFYLLATGCALGMMVLAIPLSLLFGDRSLALLFAAAALDVVPYSCFIANQGMLNGLERYRQQVIVNVVYPTGKLVLMGGGVLLFRHPAAAFVGMALASTIAWMTGAAFLRSRATRETLEALRATQAEPPREVATTLVMTGSQALFFSLDVWILQWMGVGAAVVGEYGAAQSIAKVLYMTIGTLAGPIVPSIARTGRLKKTLAEDKQVRHVMQMMIATLLIGVTIMIGAAPWVIRLMFGEKFQLAAGFLRWLASGYALLVPGLIALGILYHTRRGIISATIAIIGVIIYPLLAFILMSRTGPGGVGAALGGVGLLFLVAAPLVSRRLILQKEDVIPPQELEIP